MTTKERKQLNPTVLAMTQRSVAQTLDLARQALDAGTLQALSRPEGAPEPLESRLLRRP